MVDDGTETYKEPHESSMIMKEGDSRVSGGDVDEPDQARYSSTTRRSHGEPEMTEIQEQGRIRLINHNKTKSPMTRAKTRLLSSLQTP